MEFALDEYKLRGNVPGRMVFWTDASVNHRLKTSGTAVVFKKKPESLLSNWSACGYKLRQELRPGSFDTELLAISQALYIARGRAEQAVPQCKTVAIYSDCHEALRMLNSLGPNDAARNVLSVNRILQKTHILKSKGVQVHLHWVPGHASVPGNVLADTVARKASIRALAMPHADGQVKSER